MKPFDTKHIMRVSIPNKHKLTLIWSYSYNPWSGNKVAPFGELVAFESLWQLKLFRIRGLCLTGTTAANANYQRCRIMLARQNILDKNSEVSRFLLQLSNVTKLTAIHQLHLLCLTHSSHIIHTGTPLRNTAALPPDQLMLQSLQIKGIINGMPQLTS